MNDTAHAVVPNADRQMFYDRIAPHSLAPLWERLHNLVTRAPVTPVQAAIWHYDDEVRPHLLQAGSLISAKEAERRVLILENPGMPGQCCITRSLFAGLQLIMPGEVAPAHRHTQSALRFIIEGHGAYTAVEGEKTLMQPGDFVLTPSWTWHDHGNETDQPMVWLDGLDIPIVRLLDAGFAEPANADSQIITQPPGDSYARYGANMLPVDYQPGRASPVFNYPYERTRDALATLARNGAPDACHGYKMRYVNPATGGSPMPTIGACMQFLPRGFPSADYRCTDGTVYSVVEGEGETVVGDTVLHWKPRDIFVVPSWQTHRHHAAADAVMFSFSDRPVQQALGLWREARG